MMSIDARQCDSWDSSPIFAPMKSINPVPLIMMLILVLLLLYYLSGIR